VSIDHEFRPNPRSIFAKDSIDRLIGRSQHRATYLQQSAFVMTRSEYVILSHGSTQFYPEETPNVLDAAQQLGEIELYSRSTPLPIATC
jgi:hypothetical protein